MSTLHFFSLILSWTSSLKGSPCVRLLNYYITTSTTTKEPFLPKYNSEVVDNKSKIEIYFNKVNLLHTHTHTTQLITLNQDIKYGYVHTYKNQQASNGLTCCMCKESKVQFVTVILKPNVSFTVLFQVHSSSVRQDFSKQYNCQHTQINNILNIMK